MSIQVNKIIIYIGITYKKIDLNANCKHKISNQNRNMRFFKLDIYTFSVRQYIYDLIMNL